MKEQSLLVHFMGVYFRMIKNLFKRIAHSFSKFYGIFDISNEPCETL